jgi:hypothetical protein
MLKKKKVIYLSTFARKKNSGAFYTQFIKYFTFVRIIDVRFNLKKKNLFYYFKLFKKLKKIVSKSDIIHSQYGSGCGLIGSFFQNKKIITLRGSDIENKGLFNDFYRFFINKLTLFYLHKYDIIIVVSKKIKLKLIKNNIKNKIIFLPSPINCKKFFRIERIKAKKILNLNLFKRYIFFPVRDHQSKNKNLEFVLRLKSMLYKKNIHILFANNKFNQEQMNLLYNACECTILASDTEGWPNVIKESIFCDTPVVSTDVSDLKLLALKSKYIQISKLDVEEYCKKILFVVNLKRPKNLNKLINFCSLNYYLMHTKSLYKDLIYKSYS